MKKRFGIILNVTSIVLFVASIILGLYFSIFRSEGNISLGVFYFYVSVILGLVLAVPLHRLGSWFNRKYFKKNKKANEKEHLIKSYYERNTYEEINVMENYSVLGYFLR